MDPYLSQRYLCANECNELDRNSNLHCWFRVQTFFSCKKVLVTQTDSNDRHLYNMDTILWTSATIIQWWECSRWLLIASITGFISEFPSLRLIAYTNLDRPIYPHLLCPSRDLIAKFITSHRLVALTIAKESYLPYTCINICK